MKIISILLCACLSLAFPIAADSSELAPDIVFGLAIEASDGFFVAPDFIAFSKTPSYQKGATDMPGLKVNAPTGARPVKNGDKVLCIGNLDPSTGCIEASRFHLNDLGWVYGEFGENKITSEGRELKLVPSADTVYCDDGRISSKSAMQGKTVDCIYSITKQGATPLAIFNGMKERSSYTGKLMDNQVTGIISFDAIKDWGTSRERRRILAQTSNKTSFFEGCAATERKDVYLNRFGYCSGTQTPDGMFLDTDVINTDIASATFGGRIFGLVVGAGNDFVKVRTVLPGLVPVTMKVKANSNTKVVVNGQEAEFKKLLDMAPGLNVSVEAVGAFTEDQFAMNARLIRVNPRETSSYFCGIFAGDNLVDFYGNKLLYREYGFLKLLYGQGAHSDGNMAEVWHYGGKVCAIGFPQVGILGLPISGKFMGMENGKLKLECKRTYDYNLFGKTMELTVVSNTKFIEGGVGVVDPSTIDVGNIINCWGFFDSGGFRLIMVDV